MSLDGATLFDMVNWTCYASFVHRRRRSSAVFVVNRGSVKNMWYNLLLVLLVHQPAAEKSDVTTHKELKWNRVVKTIRAHWSHCLYFSSCVFNVSGFFCSSPVLLLSRLFLIQPFINQSSVNQCLGNLCPATCSWDFGGLHRSMFATDDTLLCLLSKH